MFSLYKVNLKHIIWIKFYAAVRLFVLFYFFIHTFLVKLMKSLYSVIKHKMKQKERKKEKRKKKKKKEKNSCTKKKCPWACHGSPGPKYVLIFGLQAFVTFTQNSFFEYIWCYVFINSYSHNNFSRPVSCWLYCLVFNSIQNHTITCIQNCMEFQCPLYLPE